MSRRNKAMVGLWGAVRFLGAYRKGAPTVWDALSWELEGCQRERAAYPLRRRDTDYLKSPLAGVGLLFQPSDVCRVFEADCWSEVAPNGTLYATRFHDGKFPWGEGNEWDYSAEAWLRKGAKPVAVVYDRWRPELKANLENYAASHLGWIPVIPYLPDEIRDVLRHTRKG